MMPAICYNVPVASVLSATGLETKQKGKQYRNEDIFMKRFMSLVFAVVLAMSLTACGKDDAENGSSTESSTGNNVQEELLTGKHHVEIAIKDYGTVSVELDADAAPITVTNFLKLAGDGFYDGLTFHRIINGFMIQGGDPLGNGTGGSDEKIKGEFSTNGVENSLSHTRGAISMARSQQMDSASSQFFIVHEDSLYLDGQYACFGYVTEGMEFVDDICEATPVTDNNGTVAAENQPVIESIVVVD